jgi:hypothetical protein
MIGIRANTATQDDVFGLKLGDIFMNEENILKYHVTMFDLGYRCDIQDRIETKIKIKVNSHGRHTPK